NLGIQPYVDVKEAYASEGLSTYWYHCDRVREILRYASYNENITFSGFDDALDSISGAPDEHTVRSLLSSFVNETLPVALDGYIHNISTSASYTDKQYPQTIGYFTEVINGLQPGTVYSVTAHANNSVFASSGEPVFFLTRPMIPVHVKAQIIDGNPFLDWGGGEGAQKTIVERHVISSWSRGEGVEIYNDTGTNLEDTGLVPGATYYYQFWSFTNLMGLQQYSSMHASSMATLPGELLLLNDGTFSSTADSLDLRAQTSDFDWYESRNDDPTLVTLNTSALAGNTGNKASLHNYHLPSNAYLTQQFSLAQYSNVTVVFDIYIDRINDSASFDRTGHIYIGDDHQTDDGPTGTSSERFVMMAFYDATPGTTGSNLQLRARTSSTQAYGVTSEWVLIADGLSYDTWYTINVTLNIVNGTFNVSINGQMVQTHVSKYSGYTSSYVSHISFAADSDGRGDFLVDNVFSPQVNRVNAHNIPLFEGWNLIGNPCSGVIHKNEIQVVNNSILYSWDEAVQEDILLKFIYTHNRTTQTYDFTDELAPGYGYWVWTRYPCELIVATDAVGSSYMTDMLPEWNLIGIPYNYSIDKETISVLNGEEERSWNEAVTSNLVIDFIYCWNPTTQSYESIETLEPGEGYWVYSYTSQILRE
ncbi:MAG: hypothetical protein JW771_02810, partial [Candidatus Thermoplasmatota archaeon]|nr:hypothetical protein [Candidatus Thermoplasmatota archaeon]